MTRKIVMHVGPTNSGKTYHALERFMMAKSGVYCGPLKMLAVEVFHKTNERGTACDLVTGEERNYANSNQVFHRISILHSEKTKIDALKFLLPVLEKVFWKSFS